MIVELILGQNTTSLLMAGLGVRLGHHFAFDGRVRVEVDYITSVLMAGLGLMLGSHFSFHGRVRANIRI